MAAYASRRLADMADNAAAIIAIELLAACQGIEHRRPLETGEQLEQAVAMVRELVPPFDRDRYIAPEIAAIEALVQSGRFRGLVPSALLPSAA